MRFPILAKASALVAVLLGLFWALNLVSGIVAERHARLLEAQRSVAESLASSQTILGPVLQRVCTERWEVDKGEGKDRRTVTEERTVTLRALPRALSIVAHSTSDTRYRGVYRVNGYLLDAKLAGEWENTHALTPKREHDRSTLNCSPVTVWAGVSDSRGIRSARFEVQGQSVAAVPARSAAGGMQSFESFLPQGEMPSGGEPIEVMLELQLAGTQDLAFVPIADATEVSLTSDWPHPSFGGRFLPVTREVTVAGFTASWRVSALATQAPQQVRGSGSLCQHAQAGSPQASACIESFGVSFIDPVSPYTLSDRATKYGVLFIVLTFVAVALAEVLLRLRVHPVQYLLVGAALTTFFLLLVSLSEHLRFGQAYLIAGTACAALLAFYGTHVLGGIRRGLLFGLAVGGVFATLYVLLLQEQTALVIGSTLIFLVLAAVMIATRRIDWYKVIAQARAELAAPASGKVSSTQAPAASSP